MAETKAEYVTTSPFLYYGVLYVSTFVPKPIPEDMASRDLCPEMGDAKFYALNPFTGKGKWPGGHQALAIPDTKISGISAHRGKLYLGIKPLKPGESAGLHLSMGGRIIGEDGNLVRIDEPLDPPQVTMVTISSDIPYIQYWKETY
jgi:hypothetical protein